MELARSHMVPITQDALDIFNKKKDIYIMPSVNLSMVFNIRTVMNFDLWFYAKDYWLL